MVEIEKSPRGGWNTWSHPAGGWHLRGQSTESRSVTGSDRELEKRETCSSDSEAAGIEQVEFLY